MSVAGLRDNMHRIGEELSFALARAPENSWLSKTCTNPQGFLGLADLQGERLRAFPSGLRAQSAQGQVADAVGKVGQGCSRMKRQNRQRGLNEQIARIGDMLGRQFRKSLEQNRQAAAVIAGSRTERRDEMRKVALEFGPAVADDTIERATQAGMSPQPLAQDDDDVVQAVFVEAQGLIEHQPHLWLPLPAAPPAEHHRDDPRQAAGTRPKSAGFSIKSARV